MAGKLLSLKGFDLILIRHILHSRLLRLSYLEDLFQRGTFLCYSLKLLGSALTKISICVSVNKQIHTLVRKQCVIKICFTNPNMPAFLYIYIHIMYVKLFYTQRHSILITRKIIDCSSDKNKSQHNRVRWRCNRGDELIGVRKLRQRNGELCRRFVGRYRGQLQQYWTHQLHEQAAH